MSDQHAEQSGRDTGIGFGSLGAGSADSDAANPRSDRLMAAGPAVCNVEAPTIVPGLDEAAKAGDKSEDKADEQAGEMASEFKAESTNAAMPKAEPFTVEGFKVDVDAAKPATPKGDAPEADGSIPDTSGPDNPKPDAAKAAAMGRSGKLLIMSPRQRTWTHSEDHVESGHSALPPDLNPPGRGRRYAALAAMLVFAALAGAAGGALATIALSHPVQTADAAASQLATLETSVGRIDAEITALKEGLERSSSVGVSQVGKTGDRLERVDKAQTEAAAKLAKLSEAIDKLRAAGPAATTPVATAAPKEVTGTVTTPAGAQALPSPQLQAPPATTTAAIAPVTGVGRLPTVEGWVLREAARGSALIEGRSGLYEVFAGDPVPGLGRVDAIRKQDGRWVVVTSKGLIVAR